jgi:uncharacterized membrane protein
VASLRADVDTAEVHAYPVLEQTESEPALPKKRHRHTAPRSPWRSLDKSLMGGFWLVSTVVLIAQLVGLITYSNYLFRRFDVSTDFAHNAQAWYLIGHGDLSPVDTIRLIITPFWRDHFDLIIWVLAPLRWLWPSPIVLLWVQDIAIVATEAITLLWVAGICSEQLRSRTSRSVAGIIALVALVANAWWYETVSFDFHLPPIGAPFLVLAAYSFWKGRFRLALIASALALLCGAVVVELVVLVALAALCSRRVRQKGGARWAIGATLAGFAWFGLANVLGANQASNIASNYGYLAGTTSTHVGLPAIVRGALTHPSRVFTTLHAHWKALLAEVVPTGFVGLLTWWGLFFFIGLLVLTALTASPVYSSYGAAFQNLPAMPFLLIGSVMVLVRLASPKRPAATDDKLADSAPIRTESKFRRVVVRVAPVLAALLAVTATVVVLVQSDTMIRQIPKQRFLVSADQASALLQATTLVPADAEVIASYGIVGRFSEHKFVWELVGAGQRFEVNESSIYFVIAPTAGWETIRPPDATADVRYLQNVLHASTLVDRSGVWLLEWHPPNDRVFVLPGLKGAPS